MFSSNEPVAAHSYCSRLGNTLCWCLPIQPAKAVLEQGPKSCAIDFAVKTFECLSAFWNSLSSLRQQGLELGLKLELCHLIKRFKDFICSKTQNNLMEFEFFLGLLKMPKLKTTFSWYQPSSTRLLLIQGWSRQEARAEMANVPRPTLIHRSWNIINVIHCWLGIRKVTRLCWKMNKLPLQTGGG